jgi:hypothetical protein
MKEFNDEIISIRELDEMEMIDIEVSDDHLFFANDILTENSIAVAMTSDFFAAIIRDSTLDEMNEVWIKVLKNRYLPINNKKFNFGTNINFQKFFDVVQNEESDVVQDLRNDERRTTDFSNLKFE